MRTATISRTRINSKKWLSARAGYRSLFSIWPHQKPPRPLPAQWGDWHVAMSGLANPWIAANAATYRYNKRKPNTKEPNHPLAIPCIEAACPKFEDWRLTPVLPWFPRIAGPKQMQEIRFFSCCLFFPHFSWMQIDYYLYLCTLDSMGSNDFRVLILTGGIGNYGMFAE